MSSQSCVAVLGVRLSLQGPDQACKLQSGSLTLSWGVGGHEGSSGLMLRSG